MRKRILKNITIDSIQFEEGAISSIVFLLTYESSFFGLFKKEDIIKTFGIPLELVDRLVAHWKYHLKNKTKL